MSTGLQQRIAQHCDRWQTARGRAVCRWFMVFVTVGLIYSAGSQAAFGWFGAGGEVPVFFPSAGITLVALILVPVRRWSAVLAGAAVAEFVNDIHAGTTFPLVLAFVLANLAEPLIGAVLLRRVTTSPDLAKSRDLFAFLALPVAIAPLFGGLIAAGGATLLGEAVDWPEYIGHWWLGDGLGVLVVAAAVLSWQRGTRVLLQPRLVESVGLAGATIVATVAIFWQSDLRWGYVLLLTFPLIAVRLGTRGVATAGLLVSIVIAQAVSNGDALWARFDLAPRTGLVYLQLVLMIMLATMLILAAEIAGRESAARAFEIERAAHQREERARMRSDFLSAFVSELERMPDAPGRAGRLVELLVPEVADRVAIEPVSPVAPLIAFAPSEPNGWAAADRDRHVDEEWFAPVRSAQQALFIADEPRPGDAPRAQLAVPLTVGGQVTSVLVLSIERPDRSLFDSESIDFARRVANRSALLLENARLLDEQRRVTARLQRALLPASLVEHPNLDIGVRYEAGSEHLDVGGDWYDTIALPDGRIGIAVGDVVGHGLAAAIAMGELRTALAALAPTAVSPSDLLGRLDRFAATLRGAEYSTVCYCILDPETGELTYAAAGHPPPLVAAPGLPARYLEDGRSQPLCASVSPTRSEATVQLAPGATLLMYSDGLVERRGERLAIGFERLRSVTEESIDLPVSALCDHVLGALASGAAPSDDIVLACVRFAPVRAGRFLRVIPAHPSQLRELRAALRAWMDEEDLDHSDRAGLMLAIGEACANAIEHAYVGTTPGKVEVEVNRLPEGDVMVRVRDFGTWRNAGGDRSRGRGTHLMRAHSDRFHRRTTPQGTEVVMTHAARQTHADD